MRTKKMADWTDEETEILITMWHEGYSGSQIASRIGNGRTRNSVIGRANRLGLGRHRKARRLGSHHPSNRKLLVLKPTLLKEPDIDRLSEIVEAKINAKKRKKKVGKHGIGLMALTGYTCHFPLWKTGELGNRYCGKPCKEGSSYCQEHHELTHQALAPRKQKPSKSEMLVILGTEAA